MIASNLVFWSWVEGMRRGGELAVSTPFSSCTSAALAAASFGGVGAASLLLLERCSATAPPRGRRFVSLAVIGAALICGAVGWLQAYDFQQRVLDVNRELHRLIADFGLSSELSVDQVRAMAAHRPSPVWAAARDYLVNRTEALDAELAARLRGHSWAAAQVRTILWEYRLICWLES